VSGVGRSFIKKAFIINAGFVLTLVQPKAAMSHERGKAQKLTVDML
jgi:hypothetical protein